MNLKSPLGQVNPGEIVTAQQSFAGRVLPVIVGMLALAAFISRRPDVWLTPQFWGEDGPVFFYDAAVVGWRSLILPYAGYLHLTPRIIACQTAGLPWEFIPSAFVCYAGAVAAYVVARVAFSSLPIAPRVIGAVALIAVPHSGEVFLNVTNLNWILGALLIVNLLESAPISTPATIRRTTEIIVAGLSGPLVLLLAPFAGLWAWRGRRDVRSCVLTVAWAVAGFTQFLVLMNSSRSATGGVWTILGSLHWMVPELTHAVFIGEWIQYHPPRDRLLAAIVLLAIGGLLLDRTNRFRKEASQLFLIAAIMLVAGRLANDRWPHPFGSGARYLYLPLVLSLWGLAWIIAGSRRWATGVAVLLLVVPLAAGASRWIAPPVRQLDWPRQVREAREGIRSKFDIPPNFACPVPSLPVAAHSLRAPNERPQSR